MRVSVLGPAIERRALPVSIHVASENFTPNVTTIHGVRLGGRAEFNCVVLVLRIPKSTRDVLAPVSTFAPDCSEHSRREVPVEHSAISCNQLVGGGGRELAYVTALSI